MGAKAELLCCTLIGAGANADEPPIKAADSSDTSFMILKFIGVKRAVLVVCSYAVVEEKIKDCDVLGYHVIRSPIATTCA